jgi:hypothetical protein
MKPSVADRDHQSDVDSTEERESCALMASFLLEEEGVVMSLGLLTFS